MTIMYSLMSSQVSAVWVKLPDDVAFFAKIRPKLSALLIEWPVFLTQNCHSSVI